MASGQLFRSSENWRVRLLGGSVYLHADMTIKQKARKRIGTAPATRSSPSSKACNYADPATRFPGIATSDPWIKLASNLRPAER